nr:EOG090X00BV [Triops cancriformis]
MMRAGFSSRGHNRVLHCTPDSVTFSLFTAQELRSLSVVNVYAPISFNAVGHPVRNGVYDLAMGPWSDRSDPCNTCRQDVYSCPGHLGHIELPLPLFNPLFSRNLIRILRMSCPNCKAVVFPPTAKVLLVAKLELMDAGLLEACQSLDESKKKAVTAEDREKVLQILRTNLTAYVKKAKDEASEEGDLKDVQGTRSVESLRKSTVKTFLDKYAKTSLRCSDCRGSWRKMVFYKSRIVYTVTPSTLQSQKLTDESTMDVFNFDEEEKEENEPGKKKVRAKGSAPTMYLSAEDAREHLRELYRKDGAVLKALFPMFAYLSTFETPTDAFFLEVLAVTPPKTRPMSMSGGMLTEHAQSVAYKNVLKSVMVAKSILAACKAENVDSLPEHTKKMIEATEGKTLLEKLQSAWYELQGDVDRMVDSDTGGAIGYLSVLQIIEKKEGLFRMHMMGKRVNFAARSVITPDPNLQVEEIGIPQVFAQKLTYPTPVTEWNVTLLRKLVMNGPENYPGAVSVEDDTGRMVRLSPTDPVQREGVAKSLLTPSAGGSKSDMKQKIVHRHLQNGDVLLLNRQPSLHKPSIMAHRARVLRGEKTLRLHYANCKAYNADFDGDEMNAHFPQSELARSEAYNIAGVPHEYLVPKDGTPLSGLIQDHVVGGVQLSIRGKFFNRADYQQLVYSALKELKEPIKLLPPCLIKPVPLWSGKQVVSTVVSNLAPRNKPAINLQSTAKIGPKDYQTLPPRPWKAGGSPLSSQVAMSESEVIFRGGELLCGILDKQQYGATSYGLVHVFYELYGGPYSCKLLTSLARLFTHFLQLEGFTLGVKDILLVKKADRGRRKVVEKSQKIGDAVAAKAVGLVEGQYSEEELKAKLAEAHYAVTPYKRMAIDHEYKAGLDRINNEINKICLPAGLLRRFPHNNLSLMINSGAKGSAVNFMQITCLLGQIELEGKRPPLMMSGRSLPSFRPYDTSPRAGGFVAGRFMTGIRPQEFFFHCMAGREGLVDTAVKTSRSGYLQRCLVKHLEGLKLSYDSTVRDSDGSIVQFAYGHDGLDVCKSQFLKKSPMNVLVDNAETVMNADALEAIERRTDSSEVKAANKAVKRWQKKYGSLTDKHRNSPFLAFCRSQNLEETFIDKKKPRAGRTLTIDALEETWRNMDPEEKARFMKKAPPRPDPVASKLSSASQFGVISEQLDALIESYMEENPGKRINDEETKPNQLSSSMLRKLVYLKSIQSMCEPGEPVGLLAAQSVGEPSTQMTLNTFHFAGRGEMNVTLGIPRLREILLVASPNIQTPSMDIPLLPCVAQSKKGGKKAERIKLRLTRVTLAEVLEKVDVSERIRTQGQRARIYVIKFTFLPRESYADRFCVKPDYLLRYFESRFVLKEFLPRLRKEGAAQGQHGLFQSVVARADKKAAISEEGDEGAEPKSAATMPEEAGEESDGDDAHDDDATESKRRARKHEDQEYEEEENEEGAEDAEEQALDEPDEGVGLDDLDYADEGIVEDEFMEKKRKPVKSGKLGNVILQDEMELRRQTLINKDPFIVDYEYDTENDLWAQVTLAVPLQIHKVDLSSIVKSAAERALVHHVRDIKRAFVVRSDNSVTIKTEGINIQEMFKYQDILDLSRLYCNNIHSVAEHFGIEAAARVIVKEIQNVFQVYGITVDPRHLNLIADYMTFDGSYRPFNRLGLQDNASPLQQMSFETSMNFLVQATLNGSKRTEASPGAGSAKPDSLPKISEVLDSREDVRTRPGYFEALLEGTVSPHFFGRYPLQFRLAEQQSFEALPDECLMHGTFTCNFLAAK